MFVCQRIFVLSFGYAQNTVVNRRFNLNRDNLVILVYSLFAPGVALQAENNYTTMLLLI